MIAAVRRRNANELAGCVGWSEGVASRACGLYRGFVICNEPFDLRQEGHICRTTPLFSWFFQRRG
jgi:hypothetical protein